ncbi:hypothetical protein GLOTRDRAFT_106364 [Gloeophyllum trabeum ATCC 11539]|uniref:DUF6589 domain-containing protein n=1 Tax=Gloeophyllum trabeum (strain ATCC 11539 / FP-39264 / Madison 617) TaxID=670483 RepID=S7Q3Y8_GLOTA|nr:uncharacterized protein GLOTRDRAFT_106364 [Gloeophyllum trabeum ATCC 11539]EPQ54726.1 hypothetical protein GLOTRDRAFT_106364 [Gloeophyllum trabeum ATCC 11539]
MSSSYVGAPATSTRRARGSSLPPSSPLSWLESSSPPHALPEANGLTIGDLMLYVFDPQSKYPERWTGFLQHPSQVNQLLDCISKHSSSAARQTVRSWATHVVGDMVCREAQQTMALGVYQSHRKPIDRDYFLGLDLSRIHWYLELEASTMMTILSAFTTCRRHLTTCTTNRAAQKRNIMTFAALQCLSEFSRSNNYTKRIFSVYFYASGAQRQTLSILSHIGLTESYSNLIDKSRPMKLATDLDPAPSAPAALAASQGTTTTPTKVHMAYHIQPGTLRQMSMSMCTVARTVAATGLYATCYDNINMMLHVSEQILGRMDSQENGTCATIWPLWKAVPEDLSLPEFEHQFDRASPLSIKDDLLTPQENSMLHAAFEHTILGANFKKYEADLNRSQPCSDHIIEVHKTSLHALPAMEIEEVTIVGNAKVVKTILKELDVDTSTSAFGRIVHIFAGNQLSIAHLRAIQNIHAGQEGRFLGFGWGVWMPGLFHAKIADAHSTLFTHWGKPNMGTSNPGCLWFHNTCLHHAPITLTSLPSFQTCRDLIFTSPYSHVVHCLLLVSNESSLDNLAASLTRWEGLQELAHRVSQHFVNPNMINKMCAARSSGDAGAGDMVFKNAVLFLCDALLLREFTDAIKAWALHFRGNGLTKYAHKMLHLIHNFAYVWPEWICCVVMNNWLVNPSGQPNSWVEVDLMQEHKKIWIKNVYKAHGSAASWEWLEMMSPCVDVLRHLTNKMKLLLSLDQGVKHAEANLKNDISLLMASLADHEVYAVKNGRILGEDDGPIKDIATVGLENLMNGKSPLDEFNKAFLRLQARQRISPITGEPPSNVGTQDDAGAADGGAASMPRSMSADELCNGTHDSGVNEVSDGEPDIDADAESWYPVDNIEDLDGPTLTRLSTEDVELDMDGDSQSREEEVKDHDSEDEQLFMDVDREIEDDDADEFWGA